MGILEGAHFRCVVHQLFCPKKKFPEGSNFRDNLKAFSGLDGCFRKWWYPQIIHFNRDFHINHPFWGTPIFGNTRMLKTSRLQILDFQSSLVSDKAHHRLSLKCAGGHGGGLAINTISPAASNDGILPDISMAHP